MATDKEQLTALINATISKYSKDSIESALTETERPGVWLTDVEELKRHFVAYMETFGTDLFWQILREKGYGEVTPAVIKSGDCGIGANWNYVSFVKIEGKYEVKSITKDSWEVSMLADGSAEIHIAGENKELSTETLELKKGASMIKSGDSLLTTTEREPESSEQTALKYSKG
jgi:hypothetical protein